MLFSVIVLIAIELIIGYSIIMPTCKELIKLIRIRKQNYFSKGEIVDYSTKQDTDGGNQYSAIVKFKDSSNNEIVVDIMDYKYKPPVIGETTLIYYNPKNSFEVVANYRSSILFKVVVLFVTFTIMS